MSLDAPYKWKIRQLTTLQARLDDTRKLLDQVDEIQAEADKIRDHTYEQCLNNNHFVSKWRGENGQLCFGCMLCNKIVKEWPSG